MSSNLEALEKCLQLHLQSAEPSFQLKHKSLNGQQKWRLAASPSGGRGLFASQNIEQGEIILLDAPLLTGPSAKRDATLICTICYRHMTPSDGSPKLCQHGCGMPVCDNCQAAPQHKAECTILQQWQPITQGTQMQLTALRLLILVRSLCLNATQIELLHMLQSGNITKHVEHEIESARDAFLQFPAPESAHMQLMRHTLSVLIVNVFAVKSDADAGADATLRSLYPLVSLLNHACTPNATYKMDGDRECVATIRATKSIAMGEEICITYTQLLWSTLTRRMHMKMTKGFLCTCPRCADATESGTMLSALRCFEKPCGGLLLPVKALNLSSPWRCDVCGKEAMLRQVAQIQEMIPNVIKVHKMNKTVHQMLDCLNNKLVRILPQSNAFIVEFKLDIVRRGRDEAVEDVGVWKILDEYRNDLLLILEKLGAGECQLRKELIDMKPFC